MDFDDILSGDLTGSRDFGGKKNTHTHARTRTRRKFADLCLKRCDETRLVRRAGRFSR